MIDSNKDMFDTKKRQLTIPLEDTIYRLLRKHHIISLNWAEKIRDNFS